MKTFAILLVALFLCLGTCCYADPVNGGFESGSMIPGWTSASANDGTNYGYNNQAYVTQNYHHSGSYALWGEATIVGDNSETPGYPWDPPGRDLSRTYVWSALNDLTNTDSVCFSLTDWQSNPPADSWGWGQQAYFVLSDGTNMVSVLLAMDSQGGYGIYQPYTTSIGTDEREWFDFDIALTPANFGAGLDSLNKSSAKVGFCWEADNWHWESQTLRAGIAVDDVVFIPEPATYLLILAGLATLFFLRKDKGIKGS